MNQVRLFTTLFCGYLALQVAWSYRDQYRYFLLLPPQEKTALLLGHWRVLRLGRWAFLLWGVLLIGGLALAAFGWNARIGLSTALVAYFLYFGQIMQLGYVQRKTHLLPLVLGVLLLAPDSTRGWWTPGADWPLWMVQGMLAQVYLASGLAKLRGAGSLRQGWLWAEGSSMQAYLAANALTYDIPLAWKLAANARLCRLLSIGVLAFELFGFLLLLLPGTRWLFAVAGLSFHLATWLLMRINYLKYHGAVYLVFAVEPLAAFLRQALGGTESR